MKLTSITFQLSTLTKKDGLNAVTIKNLDRKLASATEEKDRILSEVSELYISPWNRIIMRIVFGTFIVNMFIS